MVIVTQDSHIKPGVTEGMWDRGIWELYAMWVAGEEPVGLKPVGAHHKTIKKVWTLAPTGILSHIGAQPVWLVPGPSEVWFMLCIPNGTLFPK